MLSWIYSISFFVSLSALILWFYNQKDSYWGKWMSRLFLGGFFVYLGTLAFSSGTLPFKLVILFRDLLVLGLVTQCFRFFKKNKILFFGMMVVLYGVFSIFYFKYLRNSFEKGYLVSVPISDRFELILELEEGTSIADLNSALSDYEVTIERAFELQDLASTDLEDFVVVGVPDKYERKIKKIKKLLKKLKIVEAVEDNEEIHLAPVEAEIEQRKSIVMPFNDPNIQQQWALEKLEVGALYNFLNSDKIKTKKRALIAILDTGVDGKHEDLASNYSSSKPNYDRDVRGHGTHCAGIAAAVTNNQIGIASLVPSNEFVRVTSIKVLSDNGIGSQRKIAQGILEAADLGADVISMSLGGRSNDSKQRAYNQAVKYANDKGAIVVVSAGNSSMNAKSFAPANSEGVITVSAINVEMRKAPFSNEVHDLKMGIAAPGVGIYSTFPKNQYRSMNGTSMSSPFVSGVIGIMKSLDPNITTSEAYKLLKDTGIDSDDTAKTGKIIQPNRAIQRLMN